jgi:hypothetical protein
MSFNINYSTKQNERLVGSPISSESHIIGIVGTSTYAPGLIRLIEVPQGPFPAVVIPGYTEIAAGVPTGSQFVVDYTTGVVTFSTAQDGTAITASYTGLGSEFAAEDVNEIQNPLSTIGNQTIVYNWPLAPTVSWSLAPNIVKPGSISNTATDDFTFPRDVFVTRNLVPAYLTSTSPSTATSGVIRLANNVDSISWRNSTNSADLPLSVNTSNQLTFNGVPIEYNALMSAHIFVGNGSNVATDVPMSGDVSITNTGVTTVLTVGGSSAANIHSAELAANAATNLDTPSTIVKRDGSGNFNASVMTATDLILTDTTSTTLDLSAGGGATLTTANSVSSITGGSVTLTTGNITTPSGTALGGSIILTTGGGGAGIGGATGGSIILTTGNQNSLAPTHGVSPIGGNITLTCGEDSTNSGTDAGGNIILTSFTPANGGNLTLTGVGASHGVITSSGNMHIDGTTFNVDSVDHSVGIGTTTPDASSSLDITSTTRGFLPPRMADPTITIVSPAEGLIAYGTNAHQWFGWNGSSWVILG